MTNTHRMAPVTAATFADAPPHSYSIYKQLQGNNARLVTLRDQVEHIRSRLHTPTQTLNAEMPLEPEDTYQQVLAISVMLISQIEEIVNRIIDEL